MARSNLRSSLISILFVALLYVASMLVRRQIHVQDNTTTIAETHTDVHHTFQAFITAVENETDWKVRITSGRRTRAEQEALYQKNKKNARPGTSKHEKGLAIDINLYQTFTLEQVRKADSRATWEATGVPAIAKKMGLRWGGLFSTYHDPVHFEVTQNSYGNSPLHSNAHPVEDEHCCIGKEAVDHAFLKAHFQNSLGVTFLPYINMAVR